LKNFEVNDTGLSSDEIKRRATEFGTNELQQKQNRSIFKVILDQFKDVMILVLIIAALLGVVFGIVKYTQKETD
jgi:Ca2+-transporting ATPase